jgi:hypothetical protein
MADDTKKNAQAVIDRLKKKGTVTDEDMKHLQQHIDGLETAAAGSHHHDHDSKLAEAVEVETGQR